MYVLEAQYHHDSVANRIWVIIMLDPHGLNLPWDLTNNIMLLQHGPKKAAGLRAHASFTGLFQNG